MFMKAKDKTSKKQTTTRKHAYEKPPTITIGWKPVKMLWKTCEIPCEKTCELFNFTCFFTCFSHLFHRVWKCWDPVKRAVFTGSKPMQNPVKTLWKTLWKNLWKTLWKTCELSQCFSQGRKCKNLWKGQFSQGQNLCKTLWKTMWVFNLWKTLWKTSELSQCFSWGRKSQTCEQGIFHRVRTWKNPLKWEEFTW